MKRFLGPIPTSYSASITEKRTLAGFQMALARHKIKSPLSGQLVAEQGRCALRKCIFIGRR